MRNLLALLILLPGALGAQSVTVRAPKDMLLARSEDAVYSTAADGSIDLRDGILSVYPDGSSPLWPELAIPASIAQGKVFSVLVATGEPLTTCTATVRLESGKVAATGQGFEVPAGALDPAGSPAPVRLYAVLLGVSTDEEVSLCRIELMGAAGARTFHCVRAAELVPMEVLQTRVVLNQTLTALRTRVDERTLRDQKRLDTAMTTFSPDGVYDLRAFRMPLEGTPQSAGFGDRRVYQYADGQTASTVHRGLDLVAGEGTRVGACARGRVVLVDDMVVTGKTVAIEHLPGLVSFYFHLSEILVAEGDLVEAGEAIGLVGATGLATGAHLHWELRCGGVPVEPRSCCDASVVDKSAGVRIIAAYPNQSQRR